MVRRTYVSGRSFSTTSTSTTNVCNEISDACVLSNTFFGVDLVKLIRHSHHPYHGACFGMNCHCTPCLRRLCETSWDQKSFSSSSAANWYVEVLSDTMMLGNDLLLANLLKNKRNMSTVRSFTTSR